MAVLPRGVQEGTEVDLAARVFNVLTNRAVSFPLYSSLRTEDRGWRGGDARRRRDDSTAHAPLVSVLRYGKRSRQAEIPVHLSARFTELGTLELWLNRPRPDTVGGCSSSSAAPLSQDDPGSAFRSSATRCWCRRSRRPRRTAAGRCVRRRDGRARRRRRLSRSIETLVGFGKQAWPVLVLRRLCDRLLRAADARRHGNRSRRDG